LEKEKEVVEGGMTSWVDVDNLLVGFPPKTRAGDLNSTEKSIKI
jgi:hypothetical protein